MVDFSIVVIANAALLIVFLILAGIMASVGSRHKRGYGIEAIQEPLKRRTRQLIVLMFFYAIVAAVLNLVLSFFVERGGHT